MVDAAAYCVVAVESAGRQIPIAFLERVKEDFNKRYGGGKAATAVANGLNKEFGYLYLYPLLRCIFVLWSIDGYSLLFYLCIYRSKLKEHMQYCVDHPEEISKLAKVKAQVSEVKGVMMENIEKVNSKLVVYLATAMLHKTFVVYPVFSCLLAVMWLQKNLMLMELQVKGAHF